jgi:hypothetical protein
VKEKRILVTLAALTLLSMAAAGAAFVLSRRPSLRQSSRVEVDNVAVAVTSLRRSGGRVEMGYAFEWTRHRRGESIFLFRHPFGAIDVVFWDAAGVQMKEVRKGRFFLSEDFAIGKARLHEGEVVFSPPPGAKYVGVSLFGDLVTRKVALPD